MLVIAQHEPVHDSGASLLVDIIYTAGKEREVPVELNPAYMSPSSLLQYVNRRDRTSRPIDLNENPAYSQIRITRNMKNLQHY